MAFALKKSMDVTKCFEYQIYLKQVTVDNGRAGKENGDYILLREILKINKILHYGTSENYEILISA